MCTTCGSTDVDHATRVIGYLKRVSSFSSGRQKEHQLRYYHIEKSSNKLGDIRANAITKFQEQHQEVQKEDYIKID